MAPAADVPEAAVPAADARPLINDESNPPLQVTWHQAGSAPRGGEFDPRGGLHSVSVGAKRVPLAHSTAKWSRERVRLAHCPQG